MVQHDAWRTSLLSSQGCFYPDKALRSRCPLTGMPSIFPGEAVTDPLPPITRNKILGIVWWKRHHSWGVGWWWDGQASSFPDNKRQNAPNTTQMHQRFKSSHYAFSLRWAFSVYEKMASSGLEYTIMKPATGDWWPLGSFIKPIFWSAWAVLEKVIGSASSWNRVLHLAEKIKENMDI